jgi:hypothetical protein
MNVLRRSLFLLVLAAGCPLAAVDRPSDPTLLRTLQAAEAGDLPAHLTLGYAYAHGERVEQNLEEAIRWYRAAALRGDAEASFNLGMIYMFRTVTLDFLTLEALYKDGVKVNEPLAQYKVGYAGQYLGRYDALELLKKAAEQGQHDAQLELAMVYIEGKLGQRPDPVAAAEYLKKAAPHRVEARFRLARAHLNGEGVLKSPKLAAEGFRAAAEQGHRRAQQEYGFMLSNGTGVPANEREAERWWRLADEPGPEGPFRTVDECFSRRHAVPPLDIVQAHAWFNVASSKNYKPLRMGMTAGMVMGAVEERMTDEEKQKAEEAAATLAEQVQ